MKNTADIPELESLASFAESAPFFKKYREKCNLSSQQALKALAE